MVSGCALRRGNGQQRHVREAVCETKQEFKEHGISCCHTRKKCTTYIQFGTNNDRQLCNKRYLVI